VPDLDSPAARTIKKDPMTQTHAPSRPDQDVLTRLGELGAATVYEANGQTGAFDAGLKPLDPTRTLVGRAVTLDLPPADNWYVHVAMLEAGPGDVLVVDAKGYLEAGPWGDVLTCLAQQRGLAGLVIDGAVRDSRDIIAAGFPVFARGLSIKGTTKAVPGRINVPVRVGGVTVEPGDIVVGDADGLVRVPAHQLHDALAASEARAAKESGFRDRIRVGANTLELLGLPRPAVTSTR
jgi:4-hydroxy-4-methyl-2-oxoglutarate aldolase